MVTCSQHTKLCYCDERLLLFAKWAYQLRREDENMRMEYSCYSETNKVIFSSQWRINTCTRNAKVKIMNIEKIYRRRHCKLRKARQAWTRQGCSHFYRIPTKVIVLGICKKTLFLKRKRGREEDRPSQVCNIPNFNTWYYLLRMLNIDCSL